MGARPAGERHLQRTPARRRRLPHGRDDVGAGGVVHDARERVAAAHVVVEAQGKGEQLLRQVLLDVDQDPATGTPALQNQAYMPGQLGGPLGVEFVLNASTNLGNQALLFNPLTGQVAASLPLTVTDTSFRVEIPHADLGQDDGLVNLGMLSGRLDVSDAAPNDAFLSSQLGDGTDSAPKSVLGAESRCAAPRSVVI